MVEWAVIGWNMRSTQKSMFPADFWSFGGPEGGCWGRVVPRVFSEPENMVRTLPAKCGTGYVEVVGPLSQFVFCLVMLVTLPGNRVPK